MVGLFVLGTYHILVGVGHMDNNMVRLVVHRAHHVMVRDNFVDTHHNFGGHGDIVGDYDIGDNHLVGHHLVGHHYLDGARHHFVEPNFVGHRDRGGRSDCHRRAVFFYSPQHDPRARARPRPMVADGYSGSPRTRAMEAINHTP